MKWELRPGTFCCWKLTGNRFYSASVDRGNLAQNGDETMWCWYASVTMNGVDLERPRQFWKEQDARKWCEGKIVEARLMEVGELA